ncbi:hypothetical protein [Brevundimonas sp. LM2]|uniref:hypothetical protein n=1 Tax=Brevundimonas sp. LM2 TaxID=1938605 RepID=UPI0015C56153|nr:hypothetical protein [Brevundimonas sp. LM2]
MDDSLIPTLALATLLIVALIAIVGLVMFKRKPANQHPMDKAPDGAIATVPVDDKP